MKFNGNINTLSTITNSDVLSLLQIKLNNYDWDHDPCLLYNKEKDVAFNDSYCIQFTPSSLMCHIRSTYKQNYTESTLELTKLGDIISSEIHQLFPDHYHLKSHLVAIIPHGKQIRHTDESFYHRYSKRLVVPIITTNLSYTNFDNDIYTLEVGTIYEMNNRVPHWSENNDDEIRVFLFMDLISPINLQIIKNHYKYYHE
jgi:hypothetical protein